MRNSAVAMGAILLSSDDDVARSQSSESAGPPSLPSASPVIPRAPLASVPYVALPLGSVRARGWVLKQLELQRDGLTGHAAEVLPSLTRESSAWLTGGVGEGEGWEKGPYYAKGLVSLAYTLDDKRLIAKAQSWVEAILASQGDDGFYGPRNNDDWWPRMAANAMLRDYVEASSDDRAIAFLGRYYRHMRAHLPARPLKDWGKARAGDEIETLFWLYNRTGDGSLLELADLLHDQAYPWRRIFSENSFLDYGISADDFHPKHAVNIAQALKMPVVYWQRSGSPEDRGAYQAAIAHLAADHGTAFGINSGSEMVAGRSTVEGVELCAMVESLQSAGTALRILGDARIGDQIEMIAFNALPAALSKTFRQHVYYTLANNVSARRGAAGYEVDYIDARTPAPRSGCPCCCYNLHAAWPKLVQNSWAGLAGGGLALLACIPSEASVRMADGSTVRIVCDTDYPFSESMTLTICLDKPTRFPVHVRIPGWCRQPSLELNGARLNGFRRGHFAVIDRTWESDDRVVLAFPMEMTTVRGVNESVSVRRGPLVYSLAMKEQWNLLEEGGLPGFGSFEATSKTPWNYALVLDERSPQKTLEFANKPSTENPFETGRAPVAIRAKAKRVDAWRMRADGLLTLDPPLSPVATDAAEETIELVPFGSQMLRITSFPVVGQPATTIDAWNEDFTDGLANHWIVYRGGFVRDGRLHVPHGAKGIASAALFADVEFEGDVVVGERGDAGLVFRVAEPSIGVDHYKGYYVGIDAAAGQVVLGKSDNAWMPLARKAARISANQVYRIRVEAKGPRLAVRLDDAKEPALTVNDESFAAGMLGVRSYANRASFGRLQARAPG